MNELSRADTVVVAKGKEGGREGGREGGKEGVPGTTALFHGSGGQGGVPYAVTGGIYIGVGGLINRIDFQQTAFIGCDARGVDIQCVSVLL